MTPIREMAQAGLLLSLSVDTTPLTGTAELFSVMRLALGLDRGQAEAEFDMSARRVLEMATIDGARALGLADVTGSLTPGKRADLILVRTDDVNIAPFTDAPNVIALAAAAHNVDTVVADGRVLKRDGALTVYDTREIVEETGTALRGVLARAGGPAALAAAARGARRRRLLRLIAARMFSYENVPLRTDIGSIKAMSAQADPRPPAPLETVQSPTGDLCWLLSRASWILTTEMTAALEDLGISPRAHCVLSTAMSGEHTQTEVAKAVGLDKTTMVVTLDELESRRAGRAPPVGHRPPRARHRRHPGGEQVVAPGRRRSSPGSARTSSRRCPRTSARSSCRRSPASSSDRLGEPVVCSQPVRRRAPRS